MKNKQLPLHLNICESRNAMVIYYFLRFKDRPPTLNQIKWSEHHLNLCESITLPPCLDYSFLCVVLRMSGRNTQMDFLAPSHDHMCDGGHKSLWETANQMQHSSHLATSSSRGNVSSSLFTPATQCPKGPLGQEAPLENSVFHPASRIYSDSLREPTDTCASVFQAANRGGDALENIHLHSSQDHLVTSNVFDNFDSLHKASLLEKQKIKDSSNDYKTTSVSDSTLAHPVVKRVPIFKAGRSKACNVPLLPNKAKKRLITSEKEPVKKHAGTTFNHSEISAFKPVITNGNTSDTASAPAPSLSTETGENQNMPPSNKGKTLPKKPKFGKSKPCLDKNIKKEKNSLLMKSGSAEPNREVISCYLL